MPCAKRSATTTRKGPIKTPKRSLWDNFIEFCRQYSAVATMLILTFAGAGIIAAVVWSFSDLSEAIVEVKSTLSQSINETANDILEKVNENMNKLGVLEERISHIQDDLDKIEEKIDELQQSSGRADN